MNKVLKAAHIQLQDLILFLIMTVLVLLFLVKPAMNLLKAAAFQNENEFLEAREILEEMASFGKEGEERIKEHYLKDAEYQLKYSNFSWAEDCYQKAGVDIQENMRKVYEAWAEHLASEGRYDLCVEKYAEAQSKYGLDVQEKLDGAYYQWGKAELDKKNYATAVDSLRKSNGYSNAAELLDDLQAQLETALDGGDTSLAMDLSAALGEDAGEELPLLNTSQALLAEYRDWLSVSYGGSHFAARKADGTAFVYGAGTEAFSVGDWSDVAGVYCRQDSVFGWSESGAVYATGGYQSSAFVDWSDIRQVVGNKNRVFGLRKDGSVLCYTNGQGTEPLPYANMARLAMSTDGRIAMLCSDGTVYQEMESGEMDSSITNASDIAFAGSELAVLYKDGTLTQAGTALENALLLYPSVTGDVTYITADRKPVVTYAGFDHFSLDEACYCIGNGDYWGMMGGEEHNALNECTVYLTERGELYVHYIYDHLLNHEEDTLYIDNLF